MFVYIVCIQIGDVSLPFLEFVVSGYYSFYFLHAAEMGTYLHAVQNRIFRVVILSERRGMDCTRSIQLAKRILAFQSHAL